MAAEPGKPEEQPVDDVWKAAAYGNMDKTKEFIEADPQLVNKPDATGYVRPTTQIPERDLRSRPRCIHPSSSFVLFQTAILHRQAPTQTLPRTHTSPPPVPRVPHLTSLTNAYPSTRTGSCPCSGRRSTTESRWQPTSSNEARR